MKSSTLISKLDVYYENGMNVLLIGLHGIGKSMSLKQFADENNIEAKYFSCATMDPYTDFVGIPTPRKLCTQCDMFNSTTVDFCSFCKAPLEIETLRMIRPRAIDEAELLIFDELNRADPKVLNAVLELVQFHSINGERLPKLKAVWGAINPPNGDYNVEDLDPALVDRFHAFIEMQPTVSADYLQQASGVSKDVAIALQGWWQHINIDKRGVDNFISPRRMEMVARLIAAGLDHNAALPEWQEIDREKLNVYIKKALERDQNRGIKRVGSFKNGPSDDFVYQPENMFDCMDDLTKYMKTNPTDMETHNKVLEGLTNLKGVDLAMKYGPLLENAMPSLLEGFIHELHPNTRKALIDSANPSLLEKLKDLRLDSASAVRLDNAIAVA